MMNPFRPGFQLLALMLSTTAALPAALTAQRAAGSTPADTAPAYRLEGVTVTVSRDATRRDALPRQIEVITATDLAHTAAEDVAQLLKKQATVDVIEFPGLLAGVGIRGFRPQFSGIHQRSLILIDGRPAGASNLALLSLQNIQRVEVMKGPASALYGSNAMGGVVNLVSRRSDGPLWSSATAGYGSWDIRQGSLTAGGSVGAKLDFDASLNLFEQASDYRVGSGTLFRDLIGDNVARQIFEDSVVLSPERGSGEVREHTQYGTRSSSVRLGYALGDAWRLDWRTEGMRAARVQTPGDLFYAWGDNRTLKNVARRSNDLALSGALGRHALTLRGFTAREEGESFNHADAASSTPQFINLHSWNRWRGVQLQDAMQLGVHTLIAGFDHSLARAESERFGAPGERIAPWEADSRIASSAAFVEGRFRALDERLVVTLGGRLDRISFRVEATELWDGGIAAPNQERFTVFNPSFGLQYAIASGVRLHGSGGRAFVTPTAFNVAGQVVRRDGDGVHLTLGNPELDPENSFTWDAGIGVFRAATGLDVDATYFRTRVRDRITTHRATPGGTAGDGSPILSLTSHANADDAEMAGIEWRLAYDLGARSGRRVVRPYVNSTHMLRAKESVAALTRHIRNVADLTVNFGIDYDDLRGFRTRLSGRYVGERTDDDWNVWPPAELRYPAFLTLDWTAEQRIAQRYRLGMVVSNLTDENYYEIRGYPLPGRAVQVRVAVDF